MKRKLCITGLSVCIMAAGLTLAAPFTAAAGVPSDQFPDGVYVGDHNLGGMTKEEAGKTIADYVEGLSGQEITLSIDGEEVKTTAADLGFHWSNPEAVEEASKTYEGGNLIKQYMVLKDLEVSPVKIPLETQVDSEKVTSFVTEKCAPYMTEAKDATIVKEGDQFVVTPEEVGRAIDVEATKAALDEALKGGMEQPVKAEAVVTVTQPSRTQEALSTIQDQLGAFTTKFNAGNGSRTKNLKTGVSKINGQVLMPGEELSAYVCLTPFTVANGYATAASYENGRVVDTVGGGACQICTTLYNTVLRSELEVTQRQNHSMIVTYVDPSADAAIAGTYKDLKFKNNYSTPIYVEGFVSGSSLTFNIYGKETRPANRTVKYVSETLNVTDPGAPTLKVDPSLAPGQRITEQTAHKGMKSRLWKYVYVDGVETDRELLHTDTYNASKSIVRVGPDAPAAAPVTPVETPEETQAQQNEPQTPSGMEYGPGMDSAGASGPGAPAAPASPAETEAAPGPEAPANPGE